MINTFKIYIFGILVFMMPLVGSAQSSRHWGESFSTKSALLSGAVVGGYQDESSIYYNPSILSDSSVNKFSFANGLAKVEAIRFENALGDGLDVGNWESTVDPGFISINLYPKDKLGLVWKASFFNKTNYDNGFTGEYHDTYNVFPQTPGNEVYLGRVSTRMEYNDYWYGLGIAKFLNKKLSLGVSLFARYTGLRYNYSKLIEIAGTDSNSLGGTIAVNSYAISQRGYTWRGTAKFGVNYRLNEVVHLGMVVTVPSFTIMGSTSVIKNVTRVNIPSPNGIGFLEDVVYDEEGKDMGMKIKDPLSIAVGIDLNKKKFRWNVTVEWFSKIKPYRSVDQSTGTVISTTAPSFEPIAENLSFVGGGKSIVNFAIGLEKFMNNHRSWLFGFKTDFDALKNFDYGELESYNTYSTPHTNYYHFSMGKNFKFLNYDILFGLQYSLSREHGLEAFANFKSPVEFNSQTPYRLEGDYQDNMVFKGDALTVFVGIILKNSK